VPQDHSLQSAPPEVGAAGRAARTGPGSAEARDAADFSVMSVDRRANLA